PAKMSWGKGEGSMDFEFSQEQEKFRRDVKDFLEGEMKQGTFKPSCDAWIQGFSPEFTKKVAQRGWIGLTWPEEYGGQGRSHMDRLILTEEMLRYGAPAACHWFADRQIGSAVLRYGTEEQKRDMLPKIIAGEAYVGLGLSEPEAGSDLASLQTKATEDGDDYIIDGQKMWTSCGVFMNYIYLLARTDSEAAKHRGISEFIFETDLPGITITPTIDITGSTAWAEVFFDGVRIFGNQLIGEKNRGFYQVVNQLDYERAGLERLMGNYPLFEAIVQFTKETHRNGKPLAQEPLIRQKLARLQTEFEVGRLLTYRVVLVMEEGRAPNVEAAMAKTYSTAFEQHLASISMEILGLYGQLLGESKWAPILGMAPHSYLGATGYSLQAGTSEVLRNIVALRGLGLPAS
ncbi:MAG: acyl-CoA dehydrogenase family protein, partial [Dehalococcoidales bacterium]|nr:acyl-CoA dehydrogenase family protein [Dehalococcoidales bacterium]